MLEQDKDYDDTIEYIRELISIVKNGNTTLNSPEASLFLTEMYYNKYLPTMNSSPETIVFGCTIKRKEEDPWFHTVLDDLLNVYTRAEIQKFFGLDFNQFLDLNMFEVEKLLDQAEKAKKEMMELMKDTEKEIKKKGPNNIPMNPLAVDELNNAITGNTL